LYHELSLFILVSVYLGACSDVFNIIKFITMVSLFVATVDQKTVASNHKELPSSRPAVPAPKASAKVLIPTLAKDSDTKSDSEKSSSSSPGDILGLANYASDDDNGDDEIRSSSLPNSNQQSSIKKLSEDTHDAAENGISKVELQKDSRSQKNMESGMGKTSSIESKNNNGATISELNDNRVDRDLGHAYSSKLVSEDSNDGITVSGKILDGTSASRSKNNVGLMESELPGEYVTDKKTSSNDPQRSETRMKLDKNDRHESKKSSGKDVREGDSNKTWADDNGDEKRRRRDERHPRKEKGDDWNGSKDRMKEQSFEPRVKEKQSESRKSSDLLDVKEDRKETERLHRARTKEDTSRKREHRKDEEEDTSRHKIASESSRHKKRRSSSISSKGRNSKDTSVSHANDSSDEASDDSKRLTIKIFWLCSVLPVILCGPYIWLDTAGNCNQGNITHHHLSGLGEGTHLSKSLTFIRVQVVKCQGDV